MSTDILNYFEEYREKKKEQAEYRSKRDSLMKEQQLIDSKIIDLDNDAMQGIITTMIEQGIDPTEAKLKTEAKDRSNIWYTSAYTSAPTVGSIAVLHVQDGKW